MATHSSLRGRAIGGVWEGLGGGRQGLKVCSGRRKWGGGASYRPLPSSGCSMNHHPKRYRAAPGLRQMERGLYPRVMG